MISILLFLSTVLATTNIAKASVCIDQKCSGDKVSIAYLEQNKIISSTQDGFSVKSFTVAFMVHEGEALMEKQVSGNSLETVLPLLKTQMQKGSKIYFDHVMLKNAEGTECEASGVFLTE